MSAPVALGRCLLLAVGLAAASGDAGAGNWVVEGRVVAVVDGGTLTLAQSAKLQHRIQIGAIAAPRRGQPFAAAAKDRLSALAYGKVIRALCWKRESDGGEVCVVSDGLRDIGLEMIREGLAWHDKRFENEQTSQDRQRYAREEASAKAAKRGLWADASAVAPWEWKRADGRN